MLILKFFKNQGKMWKLFAIKKNGNKVLSRIEGFLEPKSSKDENFGDLKLYEKLEFDLQTGF